MTNYQSTGNCRFLAYSLLQVRTTHEDRGVAQNRKVGVSFMDPLICIHVYVFGYDDPSRAVAADVGAKLS